MKLNERLSTKGFFVFNLVLIGSIFGFSLAFLSFSCSTPGNSKTAYAEEPPAAVVDASALAVAEELQNSFRSIAEKVLPAIVEVDVIEVTKQSTPSYNGIPWEFFFGQPQPEEGEREYRSQGLGSGVIVRRIGKVHYVVTNQHVVANASEISLRLSDGRSFPGTLIGTDERKDLALVSFESAEALPVAALGDSNDVKVGDWAIAIGSPLGYGSSMTMGIVSAVERKGGPAANINDFIQTDAAINQGNSGGALLNIRGEVVGINTWIASNTGGSVGLGFAIPVNNIKKAIDDFISTGSVRYGWLGVSLVDVSDEAEAEELILDNRKGALVSQVFIASPAEKGGFLPGDFIIAINGKTVRDRDQLVLVVGDLLAGEQASFTVIRQGQEMELTVKIEARDDKVAASNEKLWPGAIVIALTDEIRKAVEVDSSVKGVLVAEAYDKTPAATVGIKRYDVITAVNGKKVTKLSEFYEIINDKDSKELWFEFVRNGETLETPRIKK